MKRRNQSSGGCQLLVQETPNPNDQQVRIKRVVSTF